MCMNESLSAFETACADQGEASSKADREEVGGRSAALMNAQVFKRLYART